MAVNINHGKELPGLLRKLAWAYGNAGIIDKNDYYNEEASKLDRDSGLYLYHLASKEISLGNLDKAFELGYKMYFRDTNNINIQWGLAYYNSIYGNKKESFKYITKYIERLKALGQFVPAIMHRIGFIYWQNGYKKEADYYFNEQIKICQESIKMGRSYSTGLATYYDLAGVYAFKGEKEKSYQNLQRMGFNTCSPPSWWIILFKEDPLFNSIRNEPEIQQIVSDVEAKYQAEHDRVKKWMEEQGMLKKGQ